MKYIHVFLFLLIGIGCCACGINSSKNQSSNNSQSITGAQSVQYPPATEYSLEELTTQTSDFRNHIVSSYQKMQELAADDKSYAVGKEAAKKVEEKYGERIAELADIDFTGMSEEELTQYINEFADLTTAIREAKDALTLG